MSYFYTDSGISLCVLSSTVEEVVPSIQHCRCEPTPQIIGSVNHEGMAYHKRMICGKG
jgi:hypothetical protein